MTTFLRDGPVELVLDILTHLDFRSLLQCRAVCSTFRVLIDQSPNLQYKIELAVAGQEDGSHGPLDIRRKMLDRHQQRWADLQWTKEQRLRMLHGGLWELYGNVLAQNTPDKSTIYFKQLPSQSRNIEERDWSVNVREFRIRDFGIDPAQNLLIIVEQPRWQQNDHNHQIHLRTLSKGEPHPLAVGKRILTHEQERGEQVSYHIQTCGDVLGLLIDSHAFHETEVVLWNWKTGQVLINLVSDDIMAVTFLSEKHIMLGVLQTPTAVDDEEPGLVIVDFIAEPPEQRGLDEVENAFTFRFPRLADSAGVFDVTVRSDPSPTWTPVSSKSPLPFFTARYERLYVITLFVHTDENFLQPVQLYALGSSFLSLIEERVAAGQNAAHFDWHVWGPEGTRMVTPQLPQSQTWVCYVYGTRYVSTNQSRRLHAEYVSVHDFNQLALRKSKESSAAISEMDTAVVDVGHEGNAFQKMLCVTGSTTIAAGEIFEADVVTRLGYRTRRWSIPGRPGQPRVRSVMCSEDGIIIVDSENEDGEYHILTI